MSIEKLNKIREILGPKTSKYLLDYKAKKIPKKLLYVPGPNHFETVFGESDRSKKVIENLKRISSHGRLGNTGYISILPVDQGIEHGAGVSFVKNPDYFDPEEIIELALEGGCSAIASTLGVLGSISREYSDKIPFILKINHNDLLRYPNSHDQRLFASVEQAAQMGAAAVGATIYFGSPESKRQIEEISKAFYKAHQLGMATIAWCYVRNKAFTVDGINYEDAADLTGQANHLAATIEADIIKQKMPTKISGMKALNKNGNTFGKYDPRVESELLTDHPIDMCRYQVANCYMGRIGLINSGGASGKNDIYDAVYNAVVNKRAGGMGLIMGRKAFQKPRKEGVALLHAVQDVYLCNEISLA